jgi:hypothetical protein
MPSSTRPDDSLDDYPPVLINNLAFPYVSGSRFVGELYRAGGFAAIDAAWANPPQSTEQILHPERYRAGDAPQLVALAPLTDTLGVGWQQIEDNIMGEFILREYLDQQLPATTAARAALGWGGDRSAVYWNEATGVVLALRLVGHRRRTSLPRLCRLSAGLLTLATGPGRRQHVLCDGAICFRRLTASRSSCARHTAAAVLAALRLPPGALPLGRALAAPATVKQEQGRVLDGARRRRGLRRPASASGERRRNSSS